MAEVDPAHEPRVREAKARLDEAWERRFDALDEVREALDRLHEEVAAWAAARNEQEAGR